MLRLAISAGISRDLFIEQYLKFNFEKNWIQSLLSLKDKKWDKFINKNHIEINNLIDEITKLFKKLQKYSQELVGADKKNENQYKSIEKKYKKIQKEMISSMKEVHFNASTIEALMESLYELNKKLLVREGRMLRLAMSAGISRDLFIIFIQSPPSLLSFAKVNLILF